MPGSCFMIYTILMFETMWEVPDMTDGTNFLAWITIQVVKPRTRICQEIPTFRLCSWINDPNTQNLGIWRISQQVWFGGWQFSSAVVVLSCVTSGLHSDMKQRVLPYITVWRVVNIARFIFMIIITALLNASVYLVRRCLFILSWFALWSGERAQIPTTPQQPVAESRERKLLCSLGGRELVEP